MRGKKKKMNFFSLKTETFSYTVQKNLGTYANIFLICVKKHKRKKVQAIFKVDKKENSSRKKKKIHFFFKPLFTASTVSVYNASKNALSHPNF
jgi:GTPase Era involved in 16S rRNA processing